MGDESTPLTEAEARHFLRRTGFGARPEEVAPLVGVSRGAAADQALDFKPSKKKPGGRYIELVQGSWYRLMLRPRTPGLQEKLVLFFHDHFATSNRGVDDPKLMSLQNRLIRFYCKQSFRELVKQMGRDGAMMIWLDTVRNEKFVPNENYARELMELFTLGTNAITTGREENYTQQDVVQVARAFTGWGLDRRGKALFAPGLHDTKAEFPERGDKRIFTQTGGFGPQGVEFDDQGEGPQEIDRVVDHIFEHRDADGKKTVARRLAARLLEYFCHGGYADPDVARPVADQVVAASGFDSTWDTGALVRAILVHDAFYETAGLPPYGAGAKKSVSWPADFLVSTLRLLDVKPRGRFPFLAGGDYLELAAHGRNMGQSLLEPPSVFGWDWEAAWISSGTLLARYHFARDLVMARYAGGKATFRPERLIDLSLTEAGAVVDAVIDACGVTGLFTASERSALVDYLTDGSPGTPVDLTDYDFRDRKLRGLFGLVLQSPAFQLR